LALPIVPATTRLSKYCAHWRGQPTSHFGKHERPGREKRPQCGCLNQAKVELDPCAHIEHMSVPRTMARYSNMPPLQWGGRQVPPTPAASHGWPRYEAGGTSLHDWHVKGQTSPTVMPRSSQVFCAQAKLGSPDESSNAHSVGTHSGVKSLGPQVLSTHVAGE
jgi:hypothetical protein